MPNYRRFRVEGGIYFFTVVTYLRRPILTSPFARKLLHEAWMETAQNARLKPLRFACCPIIFIVFGSFLMEMMIIRPG